MKKRIALTLATTLCAIGISAFAYPEAAPPLNARSDAALTLQDFAYFSDFQFAIPGPEEVKGRFGEPDLVEEEVGFVEMNYPFGCVLLDRDDGAFWGIEIVISTDTLEGPRGLRVGDSVETLLAAFHNEDAGLPMRSDEEGVIQLFHAENDDGTVFQYGYAVYLGGEPGQNLVTIDYGFGNKNKPEQRCRVSFEVGDGVISHIQWKVGDYHF